ncbi:MAG: ABC transporter permease subunit [Chloroflexi bacterium]|nr:ABC transporter permease subunit [Chloroflexota bacterium]
MLRLLLQELQFRRNGIIGWAIGLSFFPAMYVGIYPQFEAELEGMQAIMDLEIYKAMGMSFATFEDWMASTVINIIPVIVAIYAVINGTGTLAGEEDDGKLELVVTLPIPRWQIVTAKGIALGVALFLILSLQGIVSAAVFLAIKDQIAATTLTGTDVFMAMVSAWPVVFAIAMISLFLGTLCPRRRIAALIGTAVVIISYFGSNLTGQVSSLENLEPFFLFYYFDATATAFTDGQEAGQVTALLGIALVAYGLALFFFQRRNITVGAWPWQRAKIA